jgi:hypothetical protein
MIPLPDGNTLDRTEENLPKAEKQLEAQRAAAEKKAAADQAKADKAAAKNAGEK